MAVISFCWFSSAFFELSSWRFQRGIHGQIDFHHEMWSCPWRRKYKFQPWTIDVSGTMGLWVSMKLISMWMVSWYPYVKFGNTTRNHGFPKSWSRHGNTRAASHSMSILDKLGVQTDHIRSSNVASRDDSGEWSGPGNDQTAWWINPLVQTMLEVVF